MDHFIDPAAVASCFKYPVADGCSNYHRARHDRDRSFSLKIWRFVAISVVSRVLAMNDSRTLLVASDQGRRCCTGDSAEKCRDLYASGGLEAGFRNGGQGRMTENRAG